MWFFVCYYISFYNNSNNNFDRSWEDNIEEANFGRLVTYTFGYACASPAPSTSISLSLTITDSPTSLPTIPPSTTIPSISAMPTEDKTALPLTMPTNLPTAKVTTPTTTPDPFANIPVRDIFIWRIDVVNFLHLYIFSLSRRHLANNKEEEHYRNDKSNYPHVTRRKEMNISLVVYPSLHHLSNQNHLTQNHAVILFVQTIQSQERRHVPPKYQSLYPLMP